MGHPLNDKEIEQTLDTLIQALQKKGVLPELSLDKKLEMKNSIKEGLEKSNMEISSESLKDATVQKTLSVALIAAFVMQADKNYKFDFTTLFKMNKKMDPRKSISDEERNELTPRLEMNMQGLIKKMDEVMTPEPAMRTKENDIEPVSQNITRNLIMMDEGGQAVDTDLGFTPTGSPAVITLESVLSTGRMPEEREILEEEGTVHHSPEHSHTNSHDAMWGENGSIAESLGGLDYKSPAPNPYGNK